jgi:hypothetical protein
MTRDPLGEEADPNLYRGMGGNPVNFVDPEGLNPIWRYILANLALKRVLQTNWERFLDAGKALFNSCSKGQTVIGKYPQYLQKAEELGANRFNIPMDIWNKMSAAERWAANKQFLDDAIRRGDEFILANPVTNINTVGGYFRRELEYLIQQGYKLSSDGTRMIR